MAFSESRVPIPPFARAGPDSSAAASRFRRGAAMHWRRQEDVMKVGIIGAGAVGSACALATVLRGVAREVMLVDRVQERAKAVATDIRYGAPLSTMVEIRDGGYKDLAGAALV